MPPGKSQRYSVVRIYKQKTIFKAVLLSG